MVRSAVSRTARAGATFADEVPPAELVRIVQSLSAAPSVAELERSFLASFPRLIEVPMFGYKVVDPDTGSPVSAARANVSDTFAACYDTEALHVDPVRARAIATGRPAYNRDLMSAEEWEASAVYQRAYRLHDIRHVVDVPVRYGGRIAGTLHFASSDPERAFAAGEIELADAVAAVLGHALDRMRSAAGLERERDDALTALTLTGAPVVMSEPGSPRLRLNEAASELVRDVVAAEQGLHALLARPIGGGGFSRRVEVELASGERACVHAHATVSRGGGTVAVLELERDELAVEPGLLGPLTPREREVALLVVDGLADREIAERLFLSHHTVSQYVKRIYRKLDVDSRVALTRILFGLRASVRRT
jgi:DNA-binding CsgD family transcriptional regulator/GAF domain-containing protein